MGPSLGRRGGRRGARSSISRFRHLPRGFRLAQSDFACRRQRQRREADAAGLREMQHRERSHRDARRRRRTRLPLRNRNTCEPGRQGVADPRLAEDRWTRVLRRIRADEHTEGLVTAWSLGIRLVRRIGYGFLSSCRGHPEEGPQLAQRFQPRVRVSRISPRSGRWFRASHRRHSASRSSRVCRRGYAGSRRRRRA